MLKQRQLEILKSTIKHYILTAEPVGSKTLVEQETINVSSATVRSELKELEHSGFLTHLHTSSGRIPTDQGYRYYVDHLSSPYELDSEEKQTIACAFDADYDVDPYERFVLAASNFFPGISLAITESRVYQRGLYSLFHLPDFVTLDDAQRVLYGLEQYRQVQSFVFDEVQDAYTKVYIGQENPLLFFQDCSLMMKSLSDGTSKESVIAFLGPRRLKYSKCFALLDYFSELLQRCLGGKHD